ncbi:MAG: hypothetical protein QGI83_01065, partial [Candidatus Latescibacteria bacterium]|nr:hypothetical protein [Candidatus Latescibacterota bacterium]
MGQRDLKPNRPAHLDLGLDTSTHLRHQNGEEVLLGFQGRFGFQLGPSGEHQTHAIAIRLDADADHISLGRCIHYDVDTTKHNVLQIERAALKGRGFLWQLD